MEILISNFLKQYQVKLTLYIKSYLKIRKNIPKFPPKQILCGGEQPKILTMIPKLSGINVCMPESKPGLYYNVIGSIIDDTFSAFGVAETEYKFQSISVGE